MRNPILQQFTQEGQAGLTRSGIGLTGWGKSG